MTLEIPIIYESKEFVAVEKPIGISIHNSEDPMNLLDVLERQLSIGKLFPVHRLDKETSGVQILALNESSARILAEQFQSNLVSKNYVGILRGIMKSTSGIWSNPLTDKAEGRVNPAGLSKDRIPCETRFQIVQDSKFFSMCEFDLITGRQHQIRKHAALANHALVGDGRYGDSKYNKKMCAMYATSRLFLHCSSINILDQNFSSPLPAEFTQLFSSNTDPD